MCNRNIRDLLSVLRIYRVTLGGAWISRRRPGRPRARWTGPTNSATTLELDLSLPTSGDISLSS